MRGSTGLSAQSFGSYLGDMPTGRWQVQNTHIWHRMIQQFFLSLLKACSLEHGRIHSIIIQHASRGSVRHTAVVPRPDTIRLSTDERQRASCHVSIVNKGCGNPTVPLVKPSGRLPTMCFGSNSNRQENRPREKQTAATSERACATECKPFIIRTVARSDDWSTLPHSRRAQVRRWQSPLPLLRTRYLG